MREPRFSEAFGPTSWRERSPVLCDNALTELTFRLNSSLFALQHHFLFISWFQMVWTLSRKTNCLPEHPGRYTMNCNLTTFLFHSSVSIMLSRAIHNSRGQIFNTTSRYQFSIWTYTEWKSERRIRIWLQLIIMSAKAPKNDYLMTSWNQIQLESRGMELQKLPGLSKPFCPSFQIRYAFGPKRYVYVMRGLRKHMARFLMSCQVANIERHKKYFYTWPNGIEGL